jgi:uncharacterized RDD family membrane protein YckC
MYRAPQTYGAPPPVAPGTPGAVGGQFGLQAARGIYASLGTRVGARLLDSVIVGVVWAILSKIIGHGEAAYLGFFVIYVAYFAIFEGLPRGQTPGKMAVGIAVRRKDGNTPIGFGLAILRNFIFLGLFYLLIVPGIYNVASARKDPEERCWHDKAAQDVVVRSR